MTPEDRAWLTALQKQANANTEAVVKSAASIQAFGDTLNYLAENIALANVLLAATATLCGEVAADSEVPHNRLEEILASFETGMQHVMSAEPTRVDVQNRLLEKLDMLRELAEEHLSKTLERKT